MKYSFFLLLSVLLGFYAPGLHSQNKVPVNHFSLTRDGNFMTLNMQLDISRLEVAGNEAVLLTPHIAKGKDTLALPAVGIYSRTRYYHYLRNNGPFMLSGPDETVLRAGKQPQTLPYRALFDYSPWMDNAQVYLQIRQYGCCQTILAESAEAIGNYSIYTPRYVFVQPQVEAVKMRVLSGAAYIKFPLAGTDVLPGYEDNEAELRKINALIDSVKLDKDIRVTAISIKGYASPEGIYSQNRLLASKRTEALKDYINTRHRFAPSLISTSHEPEDWQGLRSYVVASALAEKHEVLAIIDQTATSPDEKEAEIKSRFPETYSLLQTHCYPSLRHTDYHIEYHIRGFSDVAEIKELMATRPQKLSLQEFFLLAKEYEEGSEAFNEVFETAVRMYPTDPIANLNAGNAAMGRGDLQKADRYIAKAGNSAEAIYARGVYAALTTEYATAARFFEQAEQAGLPQATNALKQLEKLQ